MSREKEPRAFDIVGELRTIPFLQGIDQPALVELARACRVRSLDKQQILFSQTDPADAVYFVLTGSIDIFLSTADGRELVINEMYPGDCFGELSLLTGQPRSTGAKTSGGAVVITVPRERFLKWLEQVPELMRHLLQTTAQRLMVSSERESALAFLDSPSRIARVLLQLERQEGGMGVVHITQEVLARYVGLTRQTVAKTLGEWRRAGWITTARGRIEILAPERLIEGVERER